MSTSARIAARSLSAVSIACAGKLRNTRFVTACWLLRLNSVSKKRSVVSVSCLVWERVDVFANAGRRRTTPQTAFVIPPKDPETISPMLGTMWKRKVGQKSPGMALSLTHGAELAHIRLQTCFRSAQLAPSGWGVALGSVSREQSSRRPGEKGTIYCTVSQKVVRIGRPIIQPTKTSNLLYHNRPID